MSILNELASALNRKDEEPNQQLAIKLSTSEDATAIQELVDNLQHRNKAIRSDCIKVLYEIGAIKPDLIDSYVNEFVVLLNHKDNRLIWGSMTALGYIAPRKPHELWEHINTIIDATQNGSVITQDWGVRVLASVCAGHESYAERIFPFLMTFLQGCRPKDVPRHAESMLVAADTDNRCKQMGDVLGKRLPYLKVSQSKRVEQVLRQLETS